METESSSAHKTQLDEISEVNGVSEISEMQTINTVEIDEDKSESNSVKCLEVVKVNSTIEPLSLPEEAWLNNLIDNLHLEECKSSDEMEYDEEDPLMLLKNAVKDCYEKRVDLPRSAAYEEGPLKITSEEGAGSVMSMAEICEGLAGIFATLKTLEETRALICFELTRRRSSRAKLFLSAVVSARYVISGLWPLQVEKNLSFRRLVKLLSMKGETALKVPKDLSRSLLTFTLTSLDELLPIIYLL